MESANQPYLFPEYQSSEELMRTVPRNYGLSAGRVIFHGVLFAITCVTTTLTGSAMSTQAEGPDSVVGLLMGPHLAFLRGIANGDLVPLANGLLFTFTLLMILGAHELGHYFACRYYGVRATLPFFIPAPPFPLTPFGTFGAVIKIKDPITSRRALFDIGIAGPLAGFVFALPASIIGLMFARAVAPPTVDGSPVFNDPPLFIAIMKLMEVPKWIDWNPVYWAAWGAVLVTALNLFPVGQLDGGHVLYAVAGPRAHKWVSRLTCAAVGLLAILSWVFYSSPIWFVWALVLLFMAKVGHPPTLAGESLGRGRVLLAAIAVVVFLLCFMPFPITIT